MWIIDVMQQSTKHLHIFSDYFSHNKNYTIVRLLLTLTPNGRFLSVNHHYPIRGHSYLPCDRDFAVVKRKIKTIDRCYTFKGYVEQIIASSTYQKFTVIVPSTDDIEDYKG